MLCYFEHLLTLQVKLNFVVKIVKALSTSSVSAKDYWQKLQDAHKVKTAKKKFLVVMQAVNTGQ